MGLFALGDDDKFNYNDVVMNWVLHPFYDDVVVMILLIVLIKSSSG